MSNIKQPPEYGVPSGLKEQFQTLSAERIMHKGQIQRTMETTNRKLLYHVSVNLPSN